ncbi:MAG: extracellular solute-binding protein [Anaerolineae bacterium]|nr:extracellular solute-binding protein [Anaerolineae bacterium]
MTFTPITLAVADTNLAGYRPLIEQFEAQHSHIHVNLVAESGIVSSDEPDRIVALAAAADVFAYSLTIQENQQYLLDLRPLLNADPAFDTNDFLPGLLDGSDSLWSLPVAASYPLLFFDKTAFDMAGLAYPEPGWTLDEFLTTARALTRWEGDEVGQWGYVPFQVQLLLATQLATPLVVDGEPRLTDPDVAASLQWLADLFTLHQVSPWLENYKPVALQEASSGPDPISLVREGQAAMWSADHTVWQFGFADENIGLTTIPRSQQGYAADAVRYGFAISRGTAQPQAAWTLLTFLSQQPPVDSVIDLLVPARRSVATADSYWESVPAVMVDALQYAANNNTVSRFTPTLVDTMRGVLTAVVTANQSVSDTLAQAQAVTTGQATSIESEATAPVIVVTQPTETAAIQILFSTGLAEIHQRLAREFNEGHTDFQVTVRHIDPANNFHSEIASADCFLASAHQHQGILPHIRPLNALFDLDAELSPNDFYPTAISALTLEGKLLGMPAHFHVPLLAYNRDLFAAAGIAEPSPDWTLAEFLEIAQALTDPAVEQYGFIDPTQHSSLDNGLAQFGVSPITASDGVITVDFAAMSPVVRWYADLVHLYGVHPALPGDMIPWRDYFDRDDIFVQLVRSGRVAMWPNDDRITGIEMGWVPFPRGPSGYSFSLVDRLDAYFIAANTQHTQFCWQWLKFLVSQPAAVATGSLPAHIATTESAAFANHVGAERAALLLTAVTGASDQQTLLGYYEPWLNPAVVWLNAVTAQAAREEVDIDNALAEAADMFTRYRACVIERQAFDDSARWQACALEVDSGLQRRYR